MQHCAECGHLVAPAEETQTEWRNVARVESVAEAGYLVSLLEGEGMRADARPAESFNAINGAWHSRYTVRVPVDRVATAVRLLQEEALATIPQADSSPDAPTQRSSATTPANPWRSLAVLVTTGAAAAALFGQGNRAPAPHPAADVMPLRTLPAELRRSGGPFYSSAGPEAALHRLRFDEQSGVWELAVDANRDGRFELRKRFGGVVAAGRLAL